MNQRYLAQARHIYTEVLPDLFQRQNVVACGLGYKIRGEEQTDELGLIVSVVRKVPKERLAPKDLIPQSVDGLVTDVIETGHIRALATPLDPKARRRPAVPGVSIGHHLITAGTLGFLVEKAGERLILSNNHVLANSNSATIGDPIFQPGPLDGGDDNDRIATLAAFEPLDFGTEEAECSIADTLAKLLNQIAGLVGSTHRLQAVRQTQKYNRMDAALARPCQPELVAPEVLGIGQPIGVGDMALGQTIQKSGRSTGHTQGIVRQIDVTVDVDYHGKTARFVDQIIASKMSNPGDSGAGILDDQRRAVGLLFAGSQQVTIITPLQRILDHFQATLAT
ncbi:MAG: hypothetical protein JXB35_09935 [Anaerolineae bacterium]|nr:hypothetical protein [Anaerolineae bacterium]